MLKANYRFYNIPKKYNMLDYNEVIKTIIEKYSRCKDLISIYNWGNPSIPGISDIDILFVFNDNAKNALPFFSRNFNFLNSKARYLIRHPFIFCDEKSFRDIRYIYPSANFNFLYGNNIKINSISSEDNYYSNIALLNDIIIRHYPRDFIGQFANKRINVRDTLLRLNSLKHTANILENLTNKKNKELGKNLMIIEKLRKNWSKEKNFDLLVSLNKSALGITMEFIENFRLFLAKNDLIKINSEDKVMYDGIKNKSIFIKNWDKEKALEEMSQYIKEKNIFYSILPIELSAQLIEYSKAGGRISNYIKKNINGDVDYQIKCKDVVKKRIEILNRQAELAFKLKHSDFPAFFDFGYRNKSGANNWVLNLLDKIRF